MRAAILIALLSIGALTFDSWEQRRIRRDALLNLQKIQSEARQLQAEALLFKQHAEAILQQNDHNSVAAFAGYLQITNSDVRGAVNTLRRFISTTIAEWKDTTLISSEGWAASAYSPDRVIKIMLMQIAEQKPVSIPFGCGGATLVMLKVLEELKIPARMLHVFSSDYDNIRSHFMVEVQIDGRWEIHDPLFNMSYENKDGRKLSINEVLAETDLEKIVPCIDQDCKKSIKHIGVRDYYFGLAVVFDQETKRPAYIWNPARYDMQKRFPEDQKTFLEFAAQHYQYEFPTNTLIIAGQ